MRHLGFEVVESRYMAGMKKAVKQGNRFYVSPAMWSLMKDATSDELEHLFKNLPFIDLGEPFNPRDPLPMITQPW